MTTTWTALLDGREAAEAEEAVAEIAAALPAAMPEPTAERPADPSLASGDAGIALFFAYLALADFRGAGEEHAERADTLLERAAGTLSTLPLGASLYGGFPGVAWAIEHASRRLFTEEDEGEDGEASDFNQPVDEALLGPLSRSPWSHDFDLMKGIVGLGVYALERLPHPSAAACLEQIVARLGELAEHGPQGATWFTAPELLPEWQRVASPNGHYNLGLSHGVPGVVALLAAAAHGTTAAASRPLLTDAMRWLLAQRQPPEAGSSFGYSLPARSAVPSRLAWCYGDPGVVATLLAGARATGDAAWEAAAREIALAAAERDPETALIRDAGLCHGAAGLGHVFNRLYQATGEPELARAARYWLGQALAVRRPSGEGVARFSSWHPELQGAGGTWHADPGFLEGAAGVGLALLAAIAPVEPAWDRVLMLSAAPTGD